MMGNMAQNVQKTIDIEKVLRSKMGSKVKYVPRFVISWLKRLAQGGYAMAGSVREILGHGRFHRGRGEPARQA